MKRLSWFFVIVSFVVVGWYFVWLKALEKVEFFITNNIERLQYSNPQTDIDVHYSLKPKGFPFKAGYVVDNLGLIFYEKETMHRARVTTKGYNFVYVSIFDFYKPFMNKSIDFYTQIEDFEGRIEVESQEEEVQIRFNIARSVGQGSWGELRQYVGTISDLDVYISLEDAKDQRILTVNQLKTKTEKQLNNKYMNILAQLNVIGATFYDFEGENSFEVDSFGFDFNVLNLPTFKNGFLQNLSAFEADEATRQAVKETILNYLQRMQMANSEIKLNDYRVQIGEFVGALNFNFRLNDKLKPVGQVGIKLNNIDALNRIETLNESPVNLAHFSKDGQENLEMLFESDGQRVFLNGFPILTFIPSAGFLLDSYLQLNKETSQKIIVEGKETPEMPALIVDKTSEVALLEGLKGDVNDDISETILPQTLPVEVEIPVESELDVSKTILDQAVKTQVLIESISKTGVELEEGAEMEKISTDVRTEISPMIESAASETNPQPTLPMEILPIVSDVSPSASSLGNVELEVEIQDEPSNLGVDEMAPISLEDKNNPVISLEEISNTLVPALLNAVSETRFVSP